MPARWAHCLQVRTAVFTGENWSVKCPGDTVAPADREENRCTLQRSHDAGTAEIDDPARGILEVANLAGCAG